MFYKCWAAGQNFCKQQLIPLPLLATLLGKKKVLRISKENGKILWEENRLSIVTRKI
jgi:hypothetical protein